MIMASDRRSYVYPARQYAEQNSCIAVEEEEEPEDMLLSRFADETDLSNRYFIWFLRLDSFCLSIFVIRANFQIHDSNTSNRNINN